MASSVWKGHISFGLVTIPVRLFSAARGERVSFNQLHKTCNSRVKQPLFCPTCQRQVERTEIIKGYEYEDDQYVIVDPKELEKVEPASAHTMEIQEFVKAAEVDPIYLETSYYMVPEEAGAKAYNLLMKTMKESGLYAVAKLTMHQREHVVVVRPHGKGLTLHTMYYPDEIRQVAEYGQDTAAAAQPREQEVKLAQQLVLSLQADFEPQKYHDEYRDRVKQMIEDKLQGREVASAPEPRREKVIDLMEALKRSLAEKEARPAALKKPAAPAVLAPERPGEAEEKKPRKRAARK